MMNRLRWSLNLIATFALLTLFAAPAFAGEAEKAADIILGNPPLSSQTVKFYSHQN